jgi:hypothetical protein
MVGDELDLEIIAAGLSPSDFLGVTLPTPPPPPLPTLSPSPPIAHTPSPPPIAVLETEESSPAPPPTPPPVHKKRSKARRAPAHHPQASESGASQPKGRKPPVIRRTGYFSTSPCVSSREISSKGGGGAHFFPSLQVLQQQWVFVYFGGGVSVICQNPVVLLTLQGSTYLLPWMDQILQRVRGRRQRDFEGVLGVALGAPRGWVFFAPATQPSVVGLAADPCVFLSFS